MPPPTHPALPDLATELSEVRAASGFESDRVYLRFTTTIANIASAPLLIRADRRHRWSSEWRISQQFEERSGSRSEIVLSDATLVWGGHGHDHWHLQFGTAYRLEGRPPVDDSRRLAKAGYCFFDQVRRIASASGRAYGKDVCDGLDRTSIEMGLSSGWSDPYQWTLPDQVLEITGLPNGTYRLYADADPDDLIRESGEQNNTDWVELRITTSTRPARARVVARAPRALQPRAP